MNFETFLVIYAAVFTVVGISLDRAYLRGKKKFRDGERQ